MDSPRAAHWSRVSDTLNADGHAPFWHPREERLYWLDTALHKLWRTHPRSGQTESLTLTAEPGCVAPCRTGGLLLALRDGIYHLASWTDLPRLVQPAPYDTATQRFAGGGCDPWGRFWVGTQVDRQDRPDEAGRQQVADHEARGCARAFGGAEHGHRARRHQAPHRGGRRRVVHAGVSRVP